MRISDWSSDVCSSDLTAKGVRDLGEWLAESEVELVVMEATGVYWRPVYYGLEDRFEALWLVNAHHVKNVPGRKTDMSDAEWLARSEEHTSELQSLMRISYAVFCLKKKKHTKIINLH